MSGFPRFTAPVDSRGDGLMADLNPAQLAAVSAPPGPLLVLAGAGSGKTRVLTRRFAHLIRQGASPWRVLAITFTNRAAREMVERTEQLLGTPARQMWVSTFHAACARILRREIEALGLGYTRAFTILDGDDQRTAVREVLRDLGYSDKQFPPNAVQGRISRAKQDLFGPADMRADAQDPWTKKVADAYGAYQEKLRAANALDFDDLIAFAVRLVEDTGAYGEDECGGDGGVLAATSVAADASPVDPTAFASLPVGVRLRRMFDHVLVDEYQDTNRAQYRLVRALCREHASITAVGDEDQSIYAFRGADVSNIQRFEEDFPAARVVRLEQNYRSTQAILDAAGSVIGHNPRQYPKRLWTDQGAGERVVVYRAWDPADEAGFVAGRIAALRAQAHGWGDFAVLYRTHAQSRAIEEALLARGIPYTVVGGLRFYDRKEIKDTLAYLRLLVNPYDWVSFRRAVAAPKRGVGDATLQALAQHMAATGESLPSALSHVAAIPGAARAAKVLEAFSAMLDGLRTAAGGGQAGWGDDLPGEAAERWPGEGEGPAPVDRSPAAAARAGAGDRAAWSGTGPGVGDAGQDTGRPASVADVIEAVLARSGLLADLKSEDSIEARARMENLDELVGVARQSGADVGLGLAGVGLFLERAALVSDADGVPAAEGTADPDAGAVVLMTLHAVKGLEYPVVFLLGLEEGVFPHARATDSDAAVEEERRLCYVGMTRARQRLYLTHAGMRALYGGMPQTTRPSRFLAEIDKRLVTVQRTSGPSDGGGGLWGQRARTGGPAGPGPERAGSGMAGRGAQPGLKGAAAGGGPGLDAAAGTAALTDFSVGEHVLHPKWGEGIVVATSGQGSAGEVTIDFPDGGRRTVVLAYARLRRAAEG